MEVADRQVRDENELIQRSRMRHQNQSTEYQLDSTLHHPNHVLIPVHA